MMAQQARLPVARRIVQTGGEHAQSRAQATMAPAGPAALSNGNARPALPRLKFRLKVRALLLGSGQQPLVSFFAMDPRCDFDQLYQSIISIACRKLNDGVVAIIHTS
jgi:hypothetical protein